MARSAREVLLEEARDRHKLELARYAEAHTRIGVHLAILAVFALALLRFIDKLPQDRGSFVFCLFALSAVALCVTTLVVFVLVLVVIWGFGTRFPASMKTWLDHAEKLRASHASANDAERLVAADLEQDLMESMCETADDNARKNAVRSKLMAYAGRGLVLAAGLLGVSGAADLYLTIGKDPPTEVHITAPVQIQLQPRPGGK
jgi:hypothetical protein